MQSGRKNALVSDIPVLGLDEFGRVQARDQAEAHQLEGGSGLAEGWLEDRRAHPDPRSRCSRASAKQEAWIEVENDPSASTRQQW